MPAAKGRLGSWKSGKAYPGVFALHGPSAPLVIPISNALYHVKDAPQLVASGGLMLETQWEQA